MVKESEFKTTFRIGNEVYTAFQTGILLIPPKNVKFLEDAWNAIRNEEVAEIHVYEDGTVWRYYPKNQTWERIDDGTGWNN